MIAALATSALAPVPSLYAATQGATLAGYAVTTWTEKEGLPAGRIRAIAQGFEGYLWLGLETGLVRFDGVRFVPWTDGPLPAGTVWSLLSARDHSLFVGTAGATPVVRIRDGQTTLYGAASGLPNTLVVSLYEDRGGAVWAATLAGLFRFDGRQWTRVDLVTSDTESVIGVYEDGGGRLWAATPAAVFRRDTPGDPFALVRRMDVASNVYFSFSRDRDGTMWTSDFHEGFRHLAGDRPAPRSVRHDGWGVQLLHDRRDTMWVATQGQGLWRVRIDPATGRQTTDVATMRDGLASDAVQALVEDREGNIWLGTPGGLQRLSPQRVTPRRDLGVARVLEAMPDGSLWLGASSGLTRFAGSEARTFTRADGLPGTVVLALHKGVNGDLWVATERGVATYRDGRFVPLRLPADANLPRIFAIATSGEDVWLRDFYFRLHRWRDGRLLPIDDIPENFRKNLLAVHADRRGRLWLGAGGGQLGVRNTDGTFSARQLPIGGIVRLYSDQDGTLWAGGEDGMSRIAGGEVVSLTRAQGFPGSVKSIVEDRRGDLWIGVGTGIVRVEKSQFMRASLDATTRLRYRFFNAADGVAGIPIAEGTCTGVRAADGRMWFVTSGGVTVVDPDRIGAPPVMPPVRIESVTADAQKFDPQSGLFGPSRTSHLHITFTALTLTDPTRIRFRYRLDGFDHDWIDPGASREAVYTNLPPRQYRFVVEATNGDGAWTPGATLEFRHRADVLPDQVVLPGGGRHAGALRGRVVAAARPARAPAVCPGARRAHPHEPGDPRHAAAGAGRPGAAGGRPVAHLDGTEPARARGRVLKIRKQVEEYIREARQSIWDLRSPRLVASDLPRALREAGERAIDGKPVQFDFVVKGTPHRCPPVIEEQLLHIGQEAMNNAVQHGGATRVGVEIDYDDDHTRLRVSDDGCGFDTAVAADFAGHYGLISMRERAEQVKGRVVIESAPGHGTRVEAVVPIT